MTAFSWDVEADVVKQLLAADEYRDEYVMQLHTQAENGADPVFLAFGEDAVTETGLMLPSIGHTVRVLGAKARLALSALSAAISSGGIETHTSIEYRHVLNYPIWQKRQPTLTKPIMIHPSPLDDSVDVAVDWDPFFLMFDMNVQGVAGDIVLHESIGDAVVETIAIGDATIDGGIVEFSLTASLAASTGYYFLIAAGVIEGENTVDWGGIADKTVWNFTTA